MQLIVNAILNRNWLANKIPATFHNLRGYDSHFIMQEIVKFGENIDVIPNNMKRCMSFMMG